jgi:hypothetical protein
MTAETIDGNRLVGACRKISCYIGEHEIAAVNKLFEDTLDKWVRADDGTIPSAEECHLADGVHKLQRAIAEGTRYPALTDAEMAAA